MRTSSDINTDAVMAEVMAGRAVARAMQKPHDEQRRQQERARTWHAKRGQCDADGQMDLERACEVRHG